MSQRPDPAAPPTPSNGRRTAIIILAGAFIASATTFILAYTSSHRAQQADSANVSADEADLRAVLAEWQAQVASVEQASDSQRADRLLALPARTQALAAWKPRTPCGKQTQDRLSDAMHQRVTWLEHRQAGQATAEKPVDEGMAMEAALGDCGVGRGRDVNI